MGTTSNFVWNIPLLLVLLTKTPRQNLISLSPLFFSQWSWTAAGVSLCWPCVSACCQKPAWLRLLRSFCGAPRTFWLLIERPQTERNVSYLRDGQVMPNSAWEPCTHEVGEERCLLLISSSQSETESSRRDIIMTVILYSLQRYDISSFWRDI